MVAKDIMGSFPKAAAGNTHILVISDLVISDYFTCWVEAYLIPNLKATTVAKKLTSNLHADKGSNFESNVITNARY